MVWESYNKNLISNLILKGGHSDGKRTYKNDGDA